MLLDPVLQRLIRLHVFPALATAHQGAKGQSRTICCCCSSCCVTLFVVSEEERALPMVQLLKHLSSSCLAGASHLSCERPIQPAPLSGDTSDLVTNDLMKSLTTGTLKMIMDKNMISVGGQSRDPAHVGDELAQQDNLCGGVTVARQGQERQEQTFSLIL